MYTDNTNCHTTEPSFFGFDRRNDEVITGPAITV